MLWKEISSITLQSYFELKLKTFSESFRYCAIKPSLEEVHDGLALIFTPFFVVSEADETPYYYDKKESV